MRRREMLRAAHLGFLLLLLAAGLVFALIAYKILTDATVPLFSLGW